MLSFVDPDVRCATMISVHWHHVKQKKPRISQRTNKGWFSHRSGRLVRNRIGPILSTPEPTWARRPPEPAWASDVTRKGLSCITIRSFIWLWRSTDMQLLLRFQNYARYVGTHVEHFRSEVCKVSRQHCFSCTCRKEPLFKIWTSLCLMICSYIHGMDRRTDGGRQHVMWRLSERVAYHSKVAANAIIHCTDFYSSFNTQSFGRWRHQTDDNAQREFFIFSSILILFRHANPHGAFKSWCTWKYDSHI